GFYPESVVILPGDVQVCGSTHYSWSTVRSALVTLCLVLRWIPRQRCLCAFRFVRNASLRGGIGTSTDRRFTPKRYARCRSSTEISFRRRKHARVPVFGDHGCPVACEIDRGCGLCCRRRPCGLTSLRLGRDCKANRHQNQNQDLHSRGAEARRMKEPTP